MVQTLDLSQPYTVRAPSGRALITVMNRDDATPANFALLGTTAAHKVAIRIAGGCSKMTYEDKLGMLAFFAEGFAGYKGVLFSGATRDVTDDGQIDPMVTDVAGMVALQNPGALALGSAPRTEEFGLVGESRFTISSGRTVPNPDMAGLLYVQLNPSDDWDDWSGDLPVYFKLMEQWRRHGGFTAVGVTVWNGGGVTKTEARTAAEKGWPVILICGSGRGADELAEDEEFTSKPNVYVIRKDPEQLNALLWALGFLSD